MAIIISKTLIELYEKNPAVCPSRSHVCTTCPNAIFHGTSTYLRGYCQIFFKEEWNSADNKFKGYCDGNPTPPDIKPTLEEEKLMNEGNEVLNEEDNKEDSEEIQN